MRRWGSVGYKGGVCGGKGYGGGRKEVGEVAGGLRGKVL